MTLQLYSPIQAKSELGLLLNKDAFMNAILTDMFTHFNATCKFKTNVSFTMAKRSNKITRVNIPL